MPALMINDSLSDRTGSLGCMNQCVNGLPCVHEKLPDYSESGKMIPMTPSQNDRYERQALVTPEYMTIPRGLHSSIALPEPQYLAAGWATKFNPEGSPYRFNAEQRIVVDVLADRLETILHWASHLTARVKALDIALPDEHELYLNPDAEGKTCKYYFVDHTNHTIFWLDDVDPYHHDIDLPPACSVGHMKFLLQEQYWKHCEYFPHRPVPASLKNELIGVLMQARADLLTSLMSTFPYSADECEQFLQILRNDTESSEYSTWIIARLWALISRHRYHTFYGEDYARITRDQPRYDKAPAQRSVPLAVCAALMFNMPPQRADALRLLFVDEIAFGKHWREFAVDALAEWRDTRMMALGFTLIGTVSTARPTNPVSAAFGAFSVALGLSAVASSLLLLQHYAGAEKYSALTAAEHLQRIESPKYGFAPIATVHALPRALAFWSLAFLAAHVLVAVVRVRDVFVLTPALAFAVLFVLFFIKAHVMLGRGYRTENTAETQEGAPAQ